MATAPEDLIDTWISSTSLIIDSGAKEATDTFLFGSGLSPSSRRTYYYALKRFMLWADNNEIAHLAKVTPKHIASHVEGLTPHTAKTELTKPGKSRLLSRAVLGNYFNALVAAGIVATNPASFYRPRGQTRQTTPTAALTPSELLLILDVIPIDSPLGKRNRALIALLAGTGCRIAAALNLTRHAIKVVDGLREVTMLEKGEIPHHVPLSPAVWNLMQPYLDLKHAVEDAFVFAAWDKRRKTLTNRIMPYSEAYRTIQSIALAAGITDKPITPHSFRATAITALLDAGHDIHLAQRIAGHADASTTRLYDRREKAVKGKDMEHLEKALKLHNA